MLFTPDQERIHSLDVRNGEDPNTDPRSVSNTIFSPFKRLDIKRSWYLNKELRCKMVRREDESIMFEIPRERVHMLSDIMITGDYESVELAKIVDFGLESERVSKTIQVISRKIRELYGGNPWFMKRHGNKSVMPLRYVNDDERLIVIVRFDNSKLSSDDHESHEEATESREGIEEVHEEDEENIIVRCKLIKLSELEVIHNFTGLDENRNEIVVVKTALDKDDVVCGMYLEGKDVEVVMELEGNTELIYQGDSKSKINRWINNINCDNMMTECGIKGELLKINNGTVLAYEVQRCVSL